MRRNENSSSIILQILSILKIGPGAMRFEAAAARESRFQL
jgi:hypothetical protein